MAYLQSEEFLAWLVNKHGEKALRDLLQHLSEGQEFDAAFLEAFGGYPAELEGEWRKSLTHPLGGFGAFLESIHLLSIAALLAVIAFIIYLRRRARIKDRLKAAEGAGED